MIQKHSNKYIRPLTDTCCLCSKQVTGAVLLCTKHWEIYSNKAKNGTKNRTEFEKFQKYREKVREGLKNKRMDE